MKILYDSVMPYAEAFFGHIGICEPFELGKISSEALANADVLLTRSTTKVDASLLECGNNLKFVGTATAGINHFDTAALDDKNITWTSAAGCNARAVAEYVLAALLYLAEQDGFLLKNKQIAIVGVGAVGKQVADIATALGMQVVLYDPPRAAIDANFSSSIFEEVLQADIISLHAPLTHNGQYPTKHMFNSDVLNSMQSSQYIVSASRGELIDTQALLDMNDDCPQLVMDCWENEPYISTDLMSRCRLATAHIAGHSLEGKARGTSILYDKLCAFLGVEKQHSLAEFLPQMDHSHELTACTQSFAHQNLNQTSLSSLVKCFYDIENDDSFFRQHMAKSESITPIRKNYPIRREFDAVDISVDDAADKLTLSSLGFSVS
ncbi:4-phosphoerythronate dehydrogenase [Agaribacter flavus]|uniref:Erythronate-4-phosphate dehydrogenase n=1 Tax=Agaribacter flavus TaxID=1902781 RepID=A0ABV7FNU9_9ALTE